MLATCFRASIAAAALLLPAAARAGASAPPDGARRPNVLLVTVDTLRPDHCSVYGYGRETTPALERLAGEGVLFETAYTPTPTTAPSHASLFTSRYPVRHGVLKNGHVLAADQRTLAEALGQAGYQTGAVVASFVVTDRFGLSQGFARYDDDFPRATSSVRLDDWKGVPLEDGFDRPATAVTDHAIAQLQSLDRARPFFLWVHYFDPHHPYDPPAGYREKVAGDGAPAAAEPGDARLAQKILDYDAEIRFADDQIGRLVDFVDGEFGRETTLVVVASDHGEGLMQHGWMGHGADLYEELVRVVLIVRWNGRIAPHRRLAAPVSLIDVGPTMLALLGLPADGLSGSGVDLSPSLLAGGALDADRALYFQRRPYATPTRRGRDVSAPMFAVRRGKWKYVASGPATELYDLDADPRELSNRQAKDGEVAAGLAAELRRWRTQPGVTPAQSPVSDENKAKLRALGYVD